MKTFKVDDNGNMVIQNGSFILLSEQKAMEQLIYNRLALWKRDWYFNKAEGIDWLSLFEKGASQNRISNNIKEQLESDEHIKKVTSITYEAQGKRKIVIYIEVMTTEGFLKLKDYIVAGDDNE